MSPGQIKSNTRSTVFQKQLTKYQYQIIGTCVTWQSITSFTDKVFWPIWMLKWLFSLMCLVISKCVRYTPQCCFICTLTWCNACVTLFYLVTMSSYTRVDGPRLMPATQTAFMLDHVWHFLFSFFFCFGKWSEFPYGVITSNLYSDWLLHFDVNASDNIPGDSAQQTHRSQSSDKQF